jgi:putative redox protein
MASVIVRGGIGSLEQEVLVGRHRLPADEPEGQGGHDAGPSPYDYLLAALGTCTSMTLALYARRKGWPVEGITVTLAHSRIHATDCAECETKDGHIDRIDREIELAGPLTDEQRTRLIEIAERCPVHRTLASEVSIRTRLAGPAGRGS